MMALFICSFLLLGSVIHTEAQQYQPNWASLDTRATPQWWVDAKFGIFIHWGVYSVPSWGPTYTYAEWYWYDQMTPGSDTQAFHNATYGPTFKYQEFADRFTAEMFDPVEWMDIITGSGAEYMVLTSKHHEGFTLWPSAQSWNWNAVDIGPKRDLLGELFAEARNRPGFHPGMYYSLFEWFHPLYIGPNPEDYVQQIMLPQMYDLINNYKPDVFWTDGEWMQSSDFWNSPSFLAWLYNDSPVKDTIAVNDRWGNDTRDTHGGFYTPEYSTSTYPGHAWEENSGVDQFSYGFNRNSLLSHYFTAQYLVDLLIRCVCNGGNFLLDIGPRWDGTIDVVEQERLAQIGGWLKVNGDGIYGTKMWRVPSEYYTLPQYSDMENNQNNVYGAVNPAQNSSDGTIWYLGGASSLALCQSMCISVNACVSYTWMDGTQGSYANMCYGRLTNTWSLTPQNGTYSGIKVNTAISYTAKGGNVYAIVNRWHRPSEVMMLPSPIPAVGFTISLLGYQGSIQVKYQNNTANSIAITFPDLAPDQLPCDYDWTFVMTNVS